MNTTSLEQRTVARILKVNHAGEYGAIRIYRAQLFVAQHFYTSLVPFLSEAIKDEESHCRQFLAAMPARHARPCHAMFLWGFGGTILGLLTAAFGKNSIMVCTKAVEQTVHRHLEDQLNFLHSRDHELHAIITDIQIEENNHLAFANAGLKVSLLNKPLEIFITLSTEIVIWLSTQGAVSRMEKTLRLYQNK